MAIVSPPELPQVFSATGLDSPALFGNPLNTVDKLSVPKRLPLIQGNADDSGVIIIAEKTCLAIIPPLHDVQWHTGKMNARSTRHDQHGNTLIRAWPL